ncbi:MAG: hypothetical protein HYR74_01590, partial [Candidatus Eisenbacteria bacterium]|nr:hypothetical protein [Candidatus Eisenbacteria bacterium]
GAPAPQTATAAGRRGPWLWIAAALVAAAAIAAALFVTRARPPAADAGDADDRRLAGLPQTAAYDSALLLSRSGRHVESLPYYRRALNGRLDLTWVAHFNYGSALSNVGLQITDRYGVPTPVTRSSVERVALMRAALAQIDTAERLAAQPAERAMIIRSRAERLQIWGLPWDAFIQFRNAEWADSTQPALRTAAEGYMFQLRYPDQYWAPGPSRGAAPRDPASR